MASQIPSLATIQERLAGLGHNEVQALAKESGVPFGTLWKIKVGVTTNPGVATVRKFWNCLPDRRSTDRKERVNG